MIDRTGSLFGMSDAGPAAIEDMMRLGPFFSIFVEGIWFFIEL